ncbi:aspartate aminotransferase family protein [candidate division WOR-3 bacterium]|nr:aspartate aminotransferase family protein [candidate division WOR-3 bacterium]
MPFLAELYRPFDIKILKARGSYIFDQKGEPYLDSFSGIGVHIFGHSDFGISKAITSKLRKHSHLSNLFFDEEAEECAELLARRFDLSAKVIFSNSGTEAVEAALKIVKKDHPENIIVSFTGSFHGRTTGSLSLTWKRTFRERFKPLIPGVVFLPFNDGKTLEKFFGDSRENVSAVFIEPIQGSGGVVPMKEDFAALISDIQKNFGTALVADEIQSGLGRTGKFFAFENYGLSPDIVLTGKALGGGLPLGAVLAKGKYGDVLKPGEHGSTFAPNPVSLSACKEVLSRIDGNLMDKNKEKGDVFFRILREKTKDSTIVRGKGLMIGIQTDKDVRKVRDYCFRKKVLVNTIGENVIRLLPPFTIDFDEIVKICDAITEGIDRAPPAPQPK